MHWVLNILFSVSPKPYQTLQNKISDITVINID